MEGQITPSSLAIGFCYTQYLVVRFPVFGTASSPADLKNRNGSNRNIRGMSAVFALLPQYSEGL